LRHRCRPEFRRQEGMRGKCHAPAARRIDPSAFLPGDTNLSPRTKASPSKPYLPKKRGKPPRRTTVVRDQLLSTPLPNPFILTRNGVQWLILASVFAGNCTPSSHIALSARSAGAFCYPACSLSQVSFIPRSASLTFLGLWPIHSSSCPVRRRKRRRAACGVSAAGPSGVSGRARFERTLVL
jgi:hypothetical protein